MIIKKSKSEKSKKSSKDKASASQEKDDAEKKDPPAEPCATNVEPQVIDAPKRDFNTDSPMFLECKEQMRPVKKLLHKLSQKESTDDENEKKRFVKYILKIGRRISTILKSYCDSEKVESWRGNLWEFVSHFTQQDAKQLYDTYRQAIKDIFNSSPEIRKDEAIERQPVIDTSPIQIEQEENNKHAQQSLPQKRPADEGSNRKNDRPPKKKHKSSSKERKHSEKREKYANESSKKDHQPQDHSSFSRDKPPQYSQDKHNSGYEKHEPPPAHLNCNQRPIYSPYIEPHSASPDLREHKTNSHKISSQGHADSWKRRIDEDH